jgi:hypothetical protein
MKKSDYEWKLPGSTSVWLRLYVNFARTVMAAIKRTHVDMIYQVRDKRFMILWHTKIVGWMIRRKKGIEKAVEFSPAHDANVTDFHSFVRSRWIWVPQRITIRREGL